MSKIYVRNLTKTYSGIKALNNVSLEIEYENIVPLLKGFDASPEVVPISLSAPS